MFNTKSFASPAVVPQYWDDLSDKDKQGYVQLQTDISKHANRTLQKDLPVKFKRILDCTRMYINPGSNDCSKRSLVCGITWISDTAIAISTRQMSILIGKCKSSINSGFQSLGYLPVTTDLYYVEELMKVFPFMYDDCTKMRQWTIRVCTEMKTEIIDEVDNVEVVQSSTYYSDIDNSNLQEEHVEVESFLFDEFTGCDLFETSFSDCFFEM